MQTRRATPADFDWIYRMGFDVWGDGAPLTDYLAGCANSPKYRRGEWWVLESGGELAASLIVYALAEGVHGIGSIATVSEKRGQGLASRLMADVLRTLESRGSQTQYLFADISPDFYARFGFRALPAELQRSPGSVCMARGLDAGQIPDTRQLPDYF